MPDRSDNRHLHNDVDWRAREHAEKVLKAEARLSRAKARLKRLKSSLGEQTTPADAARLGKLRERIATEEEALLELAPWLSDECKASSDPLCGVVGG